MSRLIGEPGERWSLQRAVDALAESARRAGRPSRLWLAGFFYPSLVLTNEVLELFVWLLGESTDLPVPELDLDVGIRPLVEVGSASGIAQGVLLFPLLLLGMRLVAGLAALAGPEEWDTASRDERRGPPLGAAWAEGRGLMLPAAGLWLAIQFITVAAVLVFLGPVVALVNVLGLRDFSPALALFVSPVALFLFAYVTVLQVLNQLALHSLASNRRGVVSALDHAWRLVRHSPWAAVRGAAVDLLLSVTIALLGYVLGVGACVTCIFAPLFWVLIQLSLAGFTGVTRAGYWARLYRELGGLKPSDRVPGLDTGAG